MAGEEKEKTECVEILLESNVVDIFFLVQSIIKAQFSMEC